MVHLVSEVQTYVVLHNNSFTSSEEKQGASITNTSRVMLFREIKVFFVNPTEHINTVYGQKSFNKGRVHIHSNYCAMKVNEIGLLRYSDSRIIL